LQSAAARRTAMGREYRGMFSKPRAGSPLPGAIKDNTPDLSVRGIAYIKALAMTCCGSRLRGAPQRDRRSIGHSSGKPCASQVIAMNAIKDKTPAR